MLGHILLAMAITTTDQTVNVAKGVKLDVNNFAGDVNVKVWDRDAVRVEVLHSDRETVDIKPGEQTLSIRSRSVRGGPPRSLDYTITVPKWMAISVSGTYADVTMDGVGADVTVETTRGDINVSGGSGVVTLKSIQGEVTVQKAKGRIEVRAVNEGMHLADLSGDLSAETTNGSIILDRIDSSNVDLYTVNGNISYDGPIKDKGVYRLTTHNGMIAIALPERVNATLMVRTYNGSFRSTFPVKQDDQKPKRFTLTLGNGSAHLELESFGGTIALRRPGEPRPEVERERRRQRDQAHHLDVDAAIAAAYGSIPAAIAAAQAAIPQTLAAVEAATPAAIAAAAASIPEAMAEAMASLEAMPMPGPTPFVLPLPRPTPAPHIAPRVTPRLAPWPWR